MDYDTRIHKTYIDRCIYNILYLKWGYGLYNDIIYQIINKYWNLRAEPICIITICESFVGYSGGGFKRQPTWKIIIEEVKRIYPRCLYYVESSSDGKIISNSKSLNFQRFKEMGKCYNINLGFFMSGSKYERLLKGEEVDKFSDAGPFRFFDVQTLRQFKNQVSSWVTETFNDHYFLDAQNYINNTSTSHCHLF